MNKQVFTVFFFVIFAMAYFGTQFTSALPIPKPMDSDVSEPTSTFDGSENGLSDSSSAFADIDPMFSAGNSDETTATEAPESTISLPNEVDNTLSTATTTTATTSEDAPLIGNQGNEEGSEQGTQEGEEDTLAIRKN